MEDVYAQMFQQKVLNDGNMALCATYFSRRARAVCGLTLRYLQVGRP